MYHAAREIHAFPARETCVGADSISARGVCGAANRADIESAPTWGGYTAADRENRGPRVTSPSVGDDARIVPGGLWWRRVCGRGMPLPYKPRQTPGQTKWTAATALRSFCMYRTNREIHAFPARKNRVGADSISARGVNRADIESAPTWGGGTAAMAAAPPLAVGAGFIPPAGVRGGAGGRRDEGIPPYGRSVCTAPTGKSTRFRREKPV